MPEFYPVGYRDDIRAIKTGEFRPPKKGEYYISGAVPTVYRALADLDDSYHIAKKVHVRKVIAYEIIGPA